MASQPSPARAIAVGDHLPDASFPHLLHEVPGHLLLAHPGEHVRRRPVAAQSDLHEVAPADRARLDQPAHRRAVRGQVAFEAVGGVGVRVELDDTDVARAIVLRHRRDVRICDGVVAPEDDGDGACGEDLSDARLDLAMARLERGRKTFRVAIVDHAELRERIDSERDAGSRGRGDGEVVGLPDRARAEARTGSVRYTLVERRADDRHVGVLQVLRRKRQRRLTERLQAGVAGLALPIDDRHATPSPRRRFSRPAHLKGVGSTFEPRAAGARCQLPRGSRLSASAKSAERMWVMPSTCW